jgi:hypothetical protein
MTGIRSQRSMKRGSTPTPCLQLSYGSFQGRPLHSLRNPPRTNREPSVGPTSFRSKHGQLPHDLFESEHSSLVGDLVLMPVRLVVAIDRVQLLDTLNLLSQLGNLLTKSSNYKRQCWCVGCSGGRAHKSPWIGLMELNTTLGLIRGLHN